MNRVKFQQKAASLRRAFSLIEVLLAVFILSLGLLGLGAMVPVVIREQREAADATLGIIVADNAEAYLKNRPDLNRWQDFHTTGMGWGAWYVRPNWSKDYGWEPTKNKSGPDLDAESESQFNITTGRMRLQAESNSTSTPCFIRVQDRLWPDASVGGSQPRFVWDIIGRRRPEISCQPRQIEIAIFVRRIDPNIRIPVGNTLYQVLTQQVPQTDWRVPVAIEGNGQPGNRRPHLDGTGVYARPFEVGVTYEAIDGQKHPEWLRLATADAPAGPTDPKMVTWHIFSRPGQKLVDNIGNVYTVVGIVPNPANLPSLAYTVQIEPPIQDWVAYTVDPLPGTTDPAYRAACESLRHVLMTPQVPAAVSVFTVDVADLDENPSGSGTGNVSP